MKTFKSIFWGEFIQSMDFIIDFGVNSPFISVYIKFKFRNLEKLYIWPRIMKFYTFNPFVWSPK